MWRPDRKSSKSCSALDVCKLFGLEGQLCRRCDVYLATCVGMLWLNRAAYEVMPGFCDYRENIVVGRSRALTFEDILRPIFLIILEAFWHHLSVN